MYRHMDKRLMNDILTTWHCLLDKNECLEQNGGCQHSCVNKEGSFKCFCKTGYKLHSNRKDCLGMWWCLFHTSCRWRHFLDDEYCKPSLFCDLPDINLIAATNYREQDVHYIDNTAQETFNNGFAVGNIRVNESCEPIEIFSHADKNWFTVFPVLKISTMSCL